MRGRGFRLMAIRHARVELFALGVPGTPYSILGVLRFRSSGDSILIPAEFVMVSPNRRLAPSGT